MEELMRFSRVLIHRLQSLFRRSRADADLQREIEVHFEQLVKEAMASGAGESEARMISTPPVWADGEDEGGVSGFEADKPHRRFHARCAVCATDDSNQAGL